MESNRKRRGFMKGKLMPFYRAAKPSTTSAMKPSQPSPTVGFMVHSDHYVPNKPTKVSFILPAEQLMESLYGVAVDEAVDLKAASYISSVQERFKLEGINSERNIRA